MRGEAIQTLTPPFTNALGKVLPSQRLSFFLCKMEIWTPIPQGYCEDLKITACEIVFFLCLCMRAQSCLTLCNPMGCSPPACSVHGIIPAWRTEWVPISSSRGSSWPRDRTASPALACRFFTTEPPGKPCSQHTCYWSFRCMLSCIGFFATPWTAACQAPLCMEISRQAYWSGLPFPSPGDLPDPGIEPVSLASPACKISNF